MQALHAQMAPLARGNLPILILGETGVGKEYLARIVHQSSPRRDGPFMALNCAAIPSDLLEAELFGVERGAATGVSARPGKFRQAQGGTVFLDEVGDMSPELQAKLLRALQEKEVQPVGGAPTSIDVRIVSATNVDLRQRIDEGGFRGDLYYRLAGSSLRVPSVRQRRTDIPGLIEHFLRSAAREADRRIRGITVKAFKALLRYDWPGNVRELENEVRRLAFLCPGGQAIGSSMLSPEILQAEDRAVPEIPDVVRPLGTLNLEELEKRAILEALETARGTQVEAARLLGLSRDSLRRRLSRYNLEIRKTPGETSPGTA